MNKFLKSSLGLLSAALISILAYQSISSAAAQSSAESLDYEIANIDVLDKSVYKECLELAGVNLANASVRINPDAKSYQEKFSLKTPFLFHRYYAKLSPEFSAEEVFICVQPIFVSKTRFLYEFTGDELEELLQALYLPDAPRDQKILFNGEWVSNACDSAGRAFYFMMARLEADVFAIVDIPRGECERILLPVQEILWKTYRAHDVYARY
ncbi:MAG: hypothetical protein RLZZ426_238 [Actinomycetota bacterium]|jgi:hypothetical protein